MDNGYEANVLKEPPRILGESVVTVNLDTCCIDEVGIANFLKHTPCLQTLSYSHWTKSEQNWNIGKFVTAIKQGVGSHLVQLSMMIRGMRSSITPGKILMRGFQRLQRLRFPVEMALCHIAATKGQFATQEENLSDGSLVQKVEHSESLMKDLVPASVSQLSLLSRGTESHRNALDIMFCHFATKKESHLPSLEEIEIETCTWANNEHEVNTVNKDQCAWFRTETEKAGVVLRAYPWDVSHKIWE